MGKRIRIVPVLILLMFTVAGCGRQGKVSDKKYQAALEAFEEYYKDELQDTYEDITARICLDAEGMPVMFVKATDEPKDYDAVYDYMVFACVKGEVTSVMDFSGLDDEREGGIGLGLYTDGIFFVSEYSESREENGRGDYQDYLETEQTWYQIRGDECAEIAQRDMMECIGYRHSSEGEQKGYKWDIEENPEEIRFLLGKKEYTVDLIEDDAKNEDKIFKNVCDKLYSVNVRGSKYCQLNWRKVLLSNKCSPYLFMQSLLLSDNMCTDAKSFRRQISDLKEEGGKSNDEFVVWDINEYNKKGYDVDRDAYFLMYRDPLLFNETDLVKKWDEDNSYHRAIMLQLITYVMTTEDYEVIGQLDFIDTISLKKMKEQAGRHLRFYLAQQDQDEAKASQIKSDYESEDSPARTWFIDTAGDMLEENLKGENSADYLRAYIKYLSKKQESVRDEFDTQEMTLNAYTYMSQKDSNLKSAGFVLGQLGEKNELCLLTDRGILTYDRGMIYTYFLGDDETYYWNEQTNELLFMDSGQSVIGPWNEDREWVEEKNYREGWASSWDEAFGVAEPVAEPLAEPASAEWEEEARKPIGTWLYQFRSVENGKLTAICDYYLDYDEEEAYFRDWQENEDPEYEEMDWEACRDSLWQRRCGSDYEESGMDKEELDWETPCFSAHPDTDFGKKMQRTVLLYPSVDEASEEFLESGNASIEIVEPVEGRAEDVDDEVKRDAYIYALEHDPEITEELGVNQNADALKYTFLRVGENRELCLVVVRDDDWYIATLLTYRDAKAALGRQMAYGHGRGMCYWNEETGYLYESTGGSGGYYDIVWTVKDGVEYTVRRGEYEEIYPIGETLEYNYFLSGNDEPIIEGGRSLDPNLMSEEEKEVLKVRKVTEQEYNSAFLEANKGLTKEQMYRIDIGYDSDIYLQFFNTIEGAYEAIQEDPAANCVKMLPPEAASALSEINVETEVAQIREWFSETQSHLSEYDLEVFDSVVERYDSGDGLVKIVLPKGYGGRNYERDYYYYDGELYFAFVFNGEEEHRFYFSYGPLIRYIDENKNTYDYGDTYAFDDWAKWVSEEAEKYY